MAVHFNKQAAIQWKADKLKGGISIEADSYPPGGRLPLHPVTARGKRRAALRNSKQN